MMARDVSITLPSGETAVVRGVPENITDSEVSAKYGNKPSTAGDVVKGALSGLPYGLSEAAAFPARAGIGLAMRAAEAIGKPEWAEYLGRGANESVEPLVEGLQHITGGDFDPATPAGRVAKASTGTAIAAAAGPGRGKLLAAALGALSGAGSQTAAETGAGPATQVAAGILPALLPGAKAAVLPNLAASKIRETMAGTPKATIANQLEIADQSPVPLLPGQMFGEQHPMKGLQESVAASGTGGSKLQGALTRQGNEAEQFRESQAAQYRPMYQQGGQTPLTGPDLMNLMSALTQAQGSRNLATNTTPARAFDRTMTSITDNTPVASANGTVVNAPIQNMGELKSIRDELRRPNYDGMSALDQSTQRAISQALNQTLHRDSNIRDADAIFGETQRILEPTQIGRGTMGVMPGSTGADIGSAVLPASVYAAGANPILGALPVVRGVQANVAQRQLSGILSDSSGKSFREALDYSRSRKLAEALTRAMLQTQGMP